MDCPREFHVRSGFPLTIYWTKSVEKLAKSKNEEKEIIEFVVCTLVEASLKSILSLCKSASLSVTLHGYILICSTNPCGCMFSNREVIQFANRVAIHAH